MKLSGEMATTLMVFAMTLGPILELPLSGRVLSIHAVEVALVAMAIAVLLGRARQPRRVSGEEIVILVAWFWVVVWALASYFWAEEPLRALVGAVAFIEGAVAFMMGRVLFNSETVTFATPIRIVCVSLSAQLLLSLLGDLPTAGGFYALKDHSTTLMGKSNYVAFYLGFAFVYEIMAHRSRWYVFAAVAAGGLVLTLSRAGVISVAAVLALAVPYAWVMRLRERSDWFGDLALICLGIGLLVGTNVGRILTAALGEGLSAVSVSSRITLWQEGLRELGEGALGLIGLGVNWQSDPHNVILRAIRDLGLLGGLPFLLLTVAPLFLHARRSAPGHGEVLAIQAAYLSMLLHALVEPMFFDPNAQVFLGLVLAYLTLRRSRFQRPVWSRPAMSSAR